MLKSKKPILFLLFSLIMALQMLFIVNVRAEDSYEPNNTVGNAKEITVGNINGLVLLDDDWFKVLNVPAGKEFGVQLSPLPNVGYQIRLYDSAYCSIYGWDTFVAEGAINESIISFITTRTIDVYIEIKYLSGIYGGNIYNLNTYINSADDQKEPNNVKSQAVQLSQGSSSNLQLFDEDWYQFSVRSDEVISFSITTTYPNLYYSLMNEADSSLVGGNGNGTKTGRYNLTENHANSGIYYLYIYPVDTGFIRNRTYLIELELTRNSGTTSSTSTTDNTSPPPDLTWLLLVIAGVIVGVIFVVMRKKNNPFQRKIIPITIIFVMIVPLVYDILLYNINNPFRNFYMVMIPTIASLIWLIIEMIKERKSHEVASWQTTKPVSSDDGWGSITTSTSTPKTKASKDKKSLFDIFSAIVGIIGTIISIIQMLQ